MVEDVLKIVRDAEEAAEGKIKAAREKAAKILDAADDDSRRIVLELEKKARVQAEQMTKKAQAAGEKSGALILESEKKKAAELEKKSQKNADKSVKLVVESVLNVGGE